jgi:hypothetical protein
MVRNLSALLETADKDEEQERLRFYRSLVPNAVLLRDASGFVCGLCGKDYHNRKEAASCLQSCIATRQNEGVVTITTLGESYSCPTCNRHFARRDDAIDCHGRSRRLSKIFLKEVPRRGIKSWDDSGFAGLKEIDAPGQGRLLRTALRLEAMVPFATNHDFSGAQAPGRAVVAPLVQAQVTRESESHPKVAAHVNKPAQATAAPRSPAPRPSVSLPVEPRPVQDEEYTQPAVNNDEGPFREPGMKPFTRADARYKCSVCSQMYFTRTEVENCFMSHPERS